MGEWEMLNFYSSSSKAVNTEKAVVECIENSIGKDFEKASLIIVHSASGHNFEQMLAKFRSLCPKAEIVGCTGSGVIGNGFVSEAIRSMAIMVITGDEFAISSVSGINAASSVSVASECAKDLMAKNKNVKNMIVMGPGLDVNGDGIIKGLESVLGSDIPMAGATGGFGGTTPRTPIFHNETILDDGLVLVGLTDPTLKMIQTAHHGNLPQEKHRFKITKAEGVRIDELDGKPAWPTFLEAIGMAPETSPMEAILLISFGIDLSPEDAKLYDNKQILRAAIGLSEDGKSMILPSEVKEGSELVSCQRDEDYLFNGVDRLVERTLSDIGESKPVAVLQADCMARGRMGHNVVDKSEIIKRLQKPFPKHEELPWVGVYGFGEFGQLNGKNRFHNYTTSISVICRD